MVCRNSFFKEIVLLVLLAILSGCEKSITVKTKPSTYEVARFEIQMADCKLEKISFHEKNNLIFLEKKEFTKLANNINNLSSCRLELLDKVRKGFEYYEDIIKILGGKFG